MPLTPISDAIAKLDRRTPVGAALRSAEWEEVPLALRDRAFFSATVTNAHVLSEAKRRLSDSVALRTETLPNGKTAFVDRSSFIGDLRKLNQSLGLTDGSGSLTDLASQKRLGLIYDQNVQEAHGYARAKAGQSEGALAAFPAQELIRIEDRQKPRDWHQRFVAAGGRLVDGRMVALKTDPVWAKLSRFGTPWPPFDFGSGMGLQDVDYDEAVALGLIQEGEMPEPDLPDFNDKLEASTQDLDPAAMQKLQEQFGDQLLERDGRLQWQGSAIADLFSRATPGTDFKEAIKLGTATPQAIAKAAQATGDKVDLTDWQLHLTADHVRHLRDAHPELTSTEVEMLPHVWRDPDQVTVGGRKDTLVFEKELLGRKLLVEWQRQPNTKRAEVRSYYTQDTKKAGGSNVSRPQS